MRYVLSFFLTFLLALHLGCNSDVLVIDPPVRSATGKLVFSLVDAPAGVAEVVARLSREGYEDRVLRLAIADTSRTASGFYSGVPVGPWHLAIEALSDTGTL